MIKIVIGVLLFFLPGVLCIPFFKNKSLLIDIAFGLSVSVGINLFVAGILAIFGWFSQLVYLLSLTAVSALLILNIIFKWK